MDLHRDIHRVLREIGPGRSLMSNTAYDTAWLARLAEVGEPLGYEAIDWLRANQLPDGSWGASEFRYYHDRLICTLAAMTVLIRHGRAQDRLRWQRAQLALETFTKGLGADAAETIGFEMIVPAMLAEGKALGIFSNHTDSNLERLVPYRAAKLAALPKGVINRYVTVAFSAEMVGPDGLDLLDVENLQEANGSVGHSPSATAHFARYVRCQDSVALRYLRKISSDGGVPTVAPSDVFEMAWVLWNLALAGSLDDETQGLCQPHLDFLQSIWEPGQGIPQASGYTPKDGDDTGLVFDMLARFGRSVDLEAVLRWEEADYFRCFALEANPSISANIHILGALRQAGLGADDPSVRKVLRFLQRTQTIQTFWFDKWHASPYYPTAHAIIASAGCDDEMIDDAIYWMLATQNKDGAWGYYIPTAEETAYCLQALVTWKQQGHPVPAEQLQRGAAWLAEHAEPPYPPLWIGKCLYCPEMVVRSVVCSALLMVQRE